MIIVGSGKKTTTYEETIIESGKTTIALSLNEDKNYDFTLYQSYDFYKSSGEYIASYPIYSIDEMYVGQTLYRTNGQNGQYAGSQLYKYEIISLPNQNTSNLETEVNFTWYEAKENTTYEGVELEGFNLGGVDLDNVYVRKGETGNLVLVWENIKSPKWFNYTGIDANGNYEGTTAYDGTPVAYGMGKPTITTAADGTQTISWARANGLNDDYFIEKYGDSYSKEITTRPRLDGTGNTSTPQVVEDVLVIPDTYKGKPITTLFESAFVCSNEDSGTKLKYYQPAYYRDVVFGTNLTTIQSEVFKGMNKSGVTTIGVPKLNLPTSIEVLSSTITGGGNVVLQINSNVVSKGIGYREATTIFGENVTEVNDLLTSNSTLTIDMVWVFKQPTDLNVTITFSSKPKTAINTVTIYTDNNSIKNYDWSTNGNITPTFYPLSDYKG